AMNGYVGQLAGSSGSVLIDAAGMSCQQDIHVGEAGTGSLTVSGGGSLQCGHGYVGRTGNGIGTVILSGAGSSWTGTAGLDIGAGAADIGSFISAGAGTVLINGGLLSIGSDMGPSGHAATAIVNQTQAVLNFAATQHLSWLNVGSGRANLLANGSRILVTGSL